MKKQIADDIKSSLQECNLPDLTSAQRSSLVDTVLQSIVTQVRNAGHCTLRGFGSFRSHEQKARTMRNPQTGKQIEVPAKRVLRFKASPTIKEQINS